MLVHILLPRGEVELGLLGGALVFLLWLGDEGRIISHLWVLFDLFILEDPLLQILVFRFDVTVLLCLASLNGRDHDSAALLAPL